MRHDTDRMDELLGPALALERTRAAYYAKAAECAHDAAQRAEWQAARDRAWTRAQALARRLDVVCAPLEGIEDCLIDAMELARRNGDKIAAEAVARECIALAELSAVREWERIEATARAASEEALGAPRRHREATPFDGALCRAGA